MRPAQAAGTRAVLTATPSTAGSARWLRRQNDVSGPRARVLCLPHAGGTAGYFRGLGTRLRPDIEVLAVQYPGRQDRLADPMITDIRGYARHVVDAVCALDGVPLALLGHSMGALVAYEMAARYRPQLPDLAALFVSAQRPPGQHHPAPPRLGDDDSIIDYVGALGGPGSDLITDADFAELILPSIRNDLRAVANHRHLPADPLSCPIVALAGADDPSTGSEALAGWSDLTADGYRERRFAGSHFYLQHAVRDVAAEVRRTVINRQI